MSPKHGGRRRVPILLWPLAGLWRLCTWFVGLVGILSALVLGVVFMGVGVLLTMTFVGAIMGIPLFVVGLFLTMRAII